MKIALSFLRFFFMMICVAFFGIYMSMIGKNSFLKNAILGSVLGFSFGSFLIACEIFFRKYNLRTFNVTLLGLCFGYLMGNALIYIFQSILQFSPSLDVPSRTLEVVQTCILLFGIYLGTIMTFRSADHLYASIPFIRFSSVSHKKKDYLLEPSALNDPRIIDLASTGILDHHLIVPRFIVKSFYTKAESSTDETIKQQARKGLETLKKLEENSDLSLQYSETDFSEILDSKQKMIRLARLLDCNILVSDLSRVEMPMVEGIRIVNIHALSNALKPLMQTGEKIQIKIQRIGKEPMQGVGYLDDGTMVVVNGGGQFIGENIPAYVLSVKHTSSGRMIFCNAQEENIGQA